MLFNFEMHKMKCKKQNSSPHSLKMSHYITNKETRDERIFTCHLILFTVETNLV